MAKTVTLTGEVQEVMDGFRYEVRYSDGETEITGHSRRFEFEDSCEEHLRATMREAFRVIGVEERWEQT